MDIDTGRIYQPDELRERLRDKELQIELDAHQADFERQHERGRIVEVSDRVAVQQLAGQEAEARRARRKAAKAARKRNRR